MTTVVDAKGRVTIPKRLRELFGLAPSTKLELRIADGAVVLAGADGGALVSRIARLRGHAGNEPSTDEVMAMTRGDT